MPRVLAHQLPAGSSVLAGTDQGIYRWHRDDQHWEHLPSQLDALQTWALAQSPHDERVLLAGTREARLFRSEDGGASWTPLDLDMATECAVWKCRA